MYRIKHFQALMGAFPRRYINPLRGVGAPSEYLTFGQFNVPSKKNSRVLENSPLEFQIFLNETLDPGNNGSLLMSLFDVFFKMSFRHFWPFPNYPKNRFFQLSLIQ